MSPRSLSRLFLAAAMACTLSSPLVAQIPDGWYATSNLQHPTYALGPGGIYLGHPARPGVAYPVAGLPPMVTGQGLSGLAGTDNISRRPSDGALIVDGGSVALMPHAYNLYAFAISGDPVQGFSATLLQQVSLGTISNPNSLVVAQAAFLPDERMVVCADQVGAPGQPLYGHMLGLVDFGAGPAGSVSGIPISAPLTGTPNAVCVDASTSSCIIYLGLVHSWWSSSIYRVPLNNGAGGAPTLVARLPFAIRKLGLEHDGTLVAAGTSRIGTSGRRGWIRRLLASGPADVPTPLQEIDAIAIEHATGDYLVSGTLQYASQPFEVYRVTRTGTTTLVGSAPPGGSGMIGGITLDPNPETYGTATPGNNTYSWQLAPNPGGLPLVGNAGFSLTVRANQGPIAPLFAWMNVSPLRPSVPVLGVNLWVVPWFPLPIAVNPSRTTDATIPLPIPNQPHLVGSPLYFQSVFADSGAPQGIAATDGLEVTIL